MCRVIGVFQIFIAAKIVITNFINWVFNWSLALLPSMSILKNSDAWLHHENASGRKSQQPRGLASKNEPNPGGRCAKDSLRSTQPRFTTVSIWLCWWWIYLRFSSVNFEITARSSASMIWKPATAARKYVIEAEAFKLLPNKPEPRVFNLAFFTHFSLLQICVQRLDRRRA